MVYHIIILFCFIAVLFLDKYAISFEKDLSVETKNEQVYRLEKKLYVFVVLYMIALCGLRAYERTNFIGIDTYGYYLSYTRISKMQLADILSKELNDKGYDILQNVFSRFNVEFWIFLLLMACIYIGIVAVYIYKHSKNKWMSLIIFISLGFYTFAFSTIRQSIAMGICLAAYMLAEKEKGAKGLIGFCVLLWVASTIHASALVFLPVYFLQKLPYKKYMVFIFLAIAAFTMMFKNQFANLIIKLAAETSEKYETYEVVENASAGILLYLFTLMTIILKLVTDIGNGEKSKKDNSIYFILMMLILFPTVQTGGAIMRIYFYYYIFIVVYLPNVLENIDDKLTKQVAYFLLILFLLYNYIFLDWEGLVLAPYKFFWQR